ncbi:MAG: ribosomal protein [Pseudomonadota bacterium]
MATKKAATAALKNLGNVVPAKGSNIKVKRLGRGIGSGLGKTSARGGKGQTARKGGGIRAGFEGGQMPLYRRLPKRGFTNLFANRFNAINVCDLNRFDAGAQVDREALKKAGLIRFDSLPVKLLGKGKLEKKLTVVVNKASASAKQAVEKLGGKVEEK